MTVRNAPALAMIVRNAPARAMIVHLVLAHPVPAPRAADHHAQAHPDQDRPDPAPHAADLREAAPAQDHPAAARVKADSKYR
jgi:hypothetical protein